MSELTQVAPDECHGATTGVFASATSHCLMQNSTCNYATDASQAYSCFQSGWCSEPVCCGSNCTHKPICTDAAWPNSTMVGSSGCGAFPAPSLGGVLCCR